MGHASERSNTGGAECRAALAAAVVAAAAPASGPLLVLQFRDVTVAASM
jgi:hypothetical protein